MSKRGSCSSENLRRRFGLVLRNAEHVDEKHPLEVLYYWSSRGYDPEAIFQGWKKHCGFADYILRAYIY